jgi:hypothetical protein
MTYFIVEGGTIDRAFPTAEEATAYAADHPEARVIGDEWITLGELKDRVARASVALDEVASMLDEPHVESLRGQLRDLDEMIAAALGRLGLHPG